MSVVKAADSTCPGDRRPAGSVPGRLVGGRYRVDSWLGSGGMGTVWLGHDRVLERPVALKELVADEDSGVLREARAASRITHPGVVQVHDVVLDDQASDWIVMEALPGGSLSSAVREQGPLPLAAVHDLAVRILSALEAVHAAGLLHRDVKPGNVQLCGSGRIVLTDFGLASPRTVGARRGGVVTGSPAFMSPEALREGCFGVPSDLYAFGVTLYVAIEGRGPFDAETPSAFLSPTAPLPVPAPLRAGPLRGLIDGLMEPDPEHRLGAAAARAYLQAVG